MRSWRAVLAAACLALAGTGARADDFCATCEVQLGFGATYHWVGYSHGLVVPIALNFDHDRWEVAAFRFTKGQDFYDSTFGVDIHFANPYWGFSVSRRVEIFPQPHWSFIVGLGGSYKTEEDRLSSSLWNFAESAGLRITPKAGLSIELIGRHFSNGGLKLPNHGQDFATLMVSVYPGLL
jgi:hypothetical protein